MEINIRTEKIKEKIITHRILQDLKGKYKSKYLLKMTSSFLGSGSSYMAISWFLQMRDQRKDLLAASSGMLLSKLGRCFSLSHSPARWMTVS